MSNSTYCDDHYEKPWWSKELDDQREEIKQLKKKMERMEKLGQAMYSAAQRLTTDASQMRSAMEAWHKFIIKKGDL
jgi:uncharacterized protein YigA (DUF484 family)